MPKLKNNEPRPKFTGSYNEKRVFYILYSEEIVCC